MIVNQSQARESVDQIAGDLMEALNQPGSELDRQHAELYSVLRKFLNHRASRFVDLGEFKPLSPFMSSEIIWHGAKLRLINLSGDGRHYLRNVRSYELVEGDWPSDDDLIAIADWRVPALPGLHPGRFVGEVRKRGNTAQVTVGVH